MATITNGNKHGVQFSIVTVYANAIMLWRKFGKGRQRHPTITERPKFGRHLISSPIDYGVISGGDDAPHPAMATMNTTRDLGQIHRGRAVCHDAIHCSADPGG